MASRIAPAVLDYCVFSRSHPHPGLSAALKLFEAAALLETTRATTVDEVRDDVREAVRYHEHLMGVPDTVGD